MVVEKKGGHELSFIRQRGYPDGRIHNVVIKFQLVIEDEFGVLCPVYINLPKLCYEFRDLPVGYDPPKFAAATLPVEAPTLGIKGAVGNIFQKGSINFTGCDSVELARAGAQLLVATLARVLKKPLRAHNMTTVLIVTSVNMPFNINTAKMDRMLPNCSLQLEGETAFPAAQITIWSDVNITHKKKNGKRVVYICPVSGRIVLTGLNNIPAVREHIRNAYNICMPFRTRRHIARNIHQRDQVTKYKKGLTKGITKRNSNPAAQRFWKP